MTTKDIIRRFIRAAGWELQRFDNANVEQSVIKNLLRVTESDLVLDVGANIGQFGDMMLGLGFKGTLVSFEAIPAVHKRLMDHAKKKAKSWRIAPCAAIGSRSGEVEINVSSNLVSSSIFPMHRTHLDAAPDSKYVDKKTVALRRLDELSTEIIPSGGRIYIKVDTQGYEMEVLKGATQLFPRIAAIQLELSLVPLYCSAPTIVDMISFLTASGYGLFGVVPGFKDSQSGRMLQVDGFFVRGDFL